MGVCPDFPDIHDLIWMARMMPQTRKHPPINQALFIQSHGTFNQARTWVINHSLFQWIDFHPNRLIVFGIDLETRVDKYPRKLFEHLTNFYNRFEESFIVALSDLTLDLFLGGDIESEPPDTFPVSSSTPFYCWSLKPWSSGQGTTDLMRILLLAILFNLGVTRSFPHCHFC